jgi:putative ABC transport system substrate-binding protein
MRRKFFAVSLSALLFALCSAANAQQPGKIHRIGFLSGGFPGSTHWSTKLLDELRKLGYGEGKNIIVEARYTENRIERLPALAGELVRLTVDVIVAGGRNDTLAAKKATQTIPIIGLSLSDPVADGLVESLARPGGNVTGYTTILDVLAGKRLELLSEIIANLSRVAVLWNSHFPEARKQWIANQQVARELGLQAHSMEVRSAEELEPAFKQAVKARSGALSIMTGVFNNTHEKKIAGLSVKYRLPAIYDRESFAVNGGLVSYGPDESERYNRVAVFVDKILKGARPADIPVEQPTKFKFVINEKTAKQIG